MRRFAYPLALTLVLLLTIVDPSFHARPWLASVASVASPISSNERVLNLVQRGAKCDLAILDSTGVSIRSSSSALTVALARFAPEDIGKVIVVPGAGASGRNLTTTILDVANSTHVTLADTAKATISGRAQRIFYGTDDHAVIQSTVTSAISAGASIYIPSQICVSSRQITGIIPYNRMIAIIGDAMHTSGIAFTNAASGGFDFTLDFDAVTSTAGKFSASNLTIYAGADLYGMDAFALHNSGTARDYRQTYLFDNVTVAAINFGTNTFRRAFSVRHINHGYMHNVHMHGSYPAVFTGSIADDILTVTALSNTYPGAAFGVGQIVTGKGVRNPTYITAPLSVHPDGTGTYSVASSIAQFQGSISGKVLTNWTNTRGFLRPGDSIGGPGIKPAKLLSYGDAEGTTGTYNIDTDQTVGSVGSPVTITSHSNVASETLYSTYSWAGIFLDHDIVMIVQNPDINTFAIGLHTTTGDEGSPEPQNEGIYVNSGNIYNVAIAWLSDGYFSNGNTMISGQMDGTDIAVNGFFRNSPAIDWYKVQQGLIANVEFYLDDLGFSLNTVANTVFSGNRFYGPGGAGTAMILGTGSIQNTISSGNFNDLSVGIRYNGANDSANVQVGSLFNNVMTSVVDNARVKNGNLGYCNTAAGVTLGCVSPNVPELPSQRQR